MTIGSGTAVAARTGTDTHIQTADLDMQYLPVSSVSIDFLDCYRRSTPSLRHLAAQIKILPTSQGTTSCSSCLLTFIKNSQYKLTGQYAGNTLELQCSAVTLVWKQIDVLLCLYALIT